MTESSPEGVPSAAWVADLHRVFPEFHRELLRVCPELADADGVGGPTDLLPSEVLGVLLGLPDGAGLVRLDQALEAHRAAKAGDDDRDV